MNNDDKLILLIIAGFLILFVYSKKNEIKRVPIKKQVALREMQPVKQIEGFQNDFTVEQTDDLTQEDIFVKQAEMCTHIDTIRVGMNPVDAEGIFQMKAKSPECDSLARAKFCSTLKAPTAELAKKYNLTIRTANDNGKSMLYQYEKYGPGCQ